MPKADSPNPAQLSPAEVADLAERFVRCVTEYLEWDKVQRLTAATAHPTTPGSPAESDLVRRLEDTSGHKYEAAARIREDGLVLAAGLEFYGFDSSGVLSVTHCVGVGGGGPDYVRPKWEQNKVALQQAAIQLRCPDTVEQRPSDSDIETPATLRSSASTETADGSGESNIPERAKKAYGQYKNAVEALGVSKPTDREAYDALYETYKQSGELDDLPAFGSWARNVREYRLATKQQKNKPRSGRNATARDVVKRSEL
ncbi:MAG: hypothetical protein ABII12_05240 [Planctomycetota bacterium]